MHREVGHCNMLQIVRNIRDNMEFLELPGGGSYPSSAGARHNGGAQAVELEDDLFFFRDPGHRAGPRGWVLNLVAFQLIVSVDWNKQYKQQ